MVGSCVVCCCVGVAEGCPRRSSCNECGHRTADNDGESGPACLLDNATPASIPSAWKHHSCRHLPHPATCPTHPPLLPAAATLWRAMLRRWWVLRWRARSPNAGWRMLWLACRCCRWVCGIEVVRS